eukprot:10091907-Alexandrium_andersonii.AAC.1
MGSQSYGVNFVGSMCSETHCHFGDGAESRSAQGRAPELSRHPFCESFRAEREYGNENLPGAPDG